MKKFVTISRKLQYLGLLGLPMFFSNMLIWKLLWLFWLFAFIDIFYGFPIFYQSCKQLLAIPYIKFKYRFNLPNINNYQSKVNYSLPFINEWTVANGSVDRSMSHSWNIVPQRYAYDFLILDDEGSSFKGDKMKLANYYCYGQEVIAPADGIVISVVDKYPDSNIDKKGKVVCTAKDIRGNHVLIKHSDYEYSTIAHLKPKSIFVHEGQQIKRGDLIALCGNSGNTSEPHIHYQLQDNYSFFTSAGLPIPFYNIKIRDIKNYNKFDPRPIYTNIIYKFSNTTQFIHRGMNVSNN